MARLEIANEDLLINFTPIAVPPDAVYGGDIPYDTTGITFTLSTKVKCVDKFALLDKFQMAWSVGSAPCPYASTTYDFVSGGGVIIATSLKCKCETKFPLRLNDTGNCVGSWKLKVSPFTVIPCSCTMKIADAGQTKILSN
jgi:hypothetical protein